MATPFVQDLRRAAHLAWTLARSGLVPLVLYHLATGRRSPEVGRRLRVVLERLGLTYLKLGQYLATRHDLVPASVWVELEKLFEEVPPMLPGVVRQVVERELGGPISDRFSEFAAAPIASASIAQVHEAHTRDGQRVAVKVQRPGLAPELAADVRILQRLAGVVDRSGWSGTFALREVVDQFAAYTSRELDFRVEGRAADRLRQRMTPHAVAPAIHWELTTAQVLTMELIDGPSLSEVRRWWEAGEKHRIYERLPNFDLDQVLRNLTFASLHQLFITGVFHGDPHPGNILVLADNRVAFVDHGISGSLNRFQRRLLASYTAALVAGDLEGCFRHLVQIYLPTRESDEAAFRADVLATLGRWYQASRDPNAPAHERHIGRAFDEMVEVTRRHHYRSTMDYLLFWRAIIVLDSVAIRLNPRFDLVREARRFFAHARLWEEEPRLAATGLGLDVTQRAFRVPLLIAGARTYLLGGRWRLAAMGCAPSSHLGTRRLVATLLLVSLTLLARAPEPVPWALAGAGVALVLMALPHRLRRSPGP